MKNPQKEFRENLEIEEIEASKKGKRVLALYGTFPAVVYWRIKKKNLITFRKIEELYEDVRRFYVDNVVESLSLISKLKNLNALISVIPKIKTIKLLLKYHTLTLKTALFFKLVIDILTYYHTFSGEPLYRIYLSDVIPLALAFYKMLLQPTVSKMYAELFKMVESSKEEITHLIAPGRKLWTLFKTKKEYLSYYEKERLEYDNIAAGCSIDKFKL